MNETTLPLTHRSCNECGAAYDARRGLGGGSASERDAALFPFNGGTGVRANNPSWMHGAHCSDDCYEHAYSEPSTDF